MSEAKVHGRSSSGLLEFTCNCSWRQSTFLKLGDVATCVLCKLRWKLVEPNKMLPMDDQAKLTEREILDHLIQEAAEVIQAATKCQLFGMKTDWPDYGVNEEVLAWEVGDLLAMIDALPQTQRMVAIIADRRTQKIPRAERYKRLAAKQAQGAKT